MAATSDILSAMALVVSVLTFGITSWLSYYTSEWKKVMEEFNISATYDDAEEAVTELRRLIETLQVSKTRCGERYLGHLPDTLDYADIFFLHGRGLLSGNDIEPHCREIEIDRRQAQKAWYFIAANHNSHQLLHYHGGFVRSLRWLVGLPNETPLWVWRGHHMELVEPLDVANWYIVNTEDRDYCDPQKEIRPRRYVVLLQEIGRVLQRKGCFDSYEATLRTRVDRYRRVVMEQLRGTNARGEQTGSAQGARDTGGGDTQKESGAAESV